MTLVTARNTTTAPQRRARILLLRLVLLAVAGMIVGAGAPVWLRVIVALPLVIAVLGSALIAVITGREAFDTALVGTADDAGDDDANDDDAGDGDAHSDDAGDRLWSIPIAAILSVLVVVATILLLNVTGIGLSSTALVVGPGIAAVVFSVLAAVATRGSAVGSGAVAGLSRGALVRLGATAAACLVLGGALMAATSMYVVTPSQPYALARFIGPQGLQETISADPGERVVLRWQVTSFGEAIPAGAMPVEVSIGDDAFSAVPTAESAVTASGGLNDVREVRAEVVAPTEPGVYAVRIVTRPGVGGEITLSTHLRVADAPG